MAWNETKLSLTGRLGTDVRTATTPDGQPMSRFMLISNERKYDKDTGTWINGDSLLLWITCFRKLAERVAATFTVGDPVVATGRVYTHEYEKDGERRFDLRMDAIGIGPDLSLCHATIERGGQLAAVAA